MGRHDSTPRGQSEAGHGPLESQACHLHGRQLQAEETVDVRCTKPPARECSQTSRAISLQPQLEAGGVRAAGQCEPPSLAPLACEGAHGGEAPRGTPAWPGVEGSPASGETAAWAGPGVDSTLMQEWVGSAGRAGGMSTGRAWPISSWLCPGPRTREALQRLHELSPGLKTGWSGQAGCAGHS